MKKITVYILLFSLLICTTKISVSADNRDLLVYIVSGTTSAYRYHARANCPSLSRSIVDEVTLEEAAQQGFTACTRCHPPKPDFEVTVTPRPVTPSGGGDRTYIRPTGIPNHVSDSKEKNSSAPFQFNIPLVIVSTLVIYAFVAHRRLKKEEEQMRLEREKQRHIEEAERVKREQLHKIKGLRHRIELLEAELEKKQLFCIEEKKYLLAELQERLNHAYQYQVEYHHYADLYAGRSTLECSGAPLGCAVGDDGLPYDDTKNKYWGASYTFYRTAKGKTYHTHKCLYAKSPSAVPINAYNAMMSGLYSCSNCRPVLPDMTWYTKYLEIKCIRKKYHIPEPSAISEEDILNEMYIEVHR